MIKTILAFAVYFAAGLAGATTLVVNAPPGGPGDFIARSLQKVFSDNGRNLVVSYAPGAGGLIAAQQTETAAPNTFVIVGSGVAVLKPLEDPKFKKTMDSLVPVSFLFTSNVVIVTTKQEINSWSDVLTTAKTRPVSVGTWNQNLDLTLTKVLPNHINVKYKGVRDAQNDLLAGTIDLAVLPYPTALETLTHSSVKPIVSVGGNPDVVVNLSSYEQYTVLDTFLSVYASPSTSPGSVVDFNENVNKLFLDPAFLSYLKNSRLHPKPLRGPDLDSYVKKLQRNVSP